MRVKLKPPRDGLVRLLVPPADTPDAGVALRAASDGAPPHMVGHFAVFNRWTEINSWFEGNFLERIAPGAFKKTVRDQRSSIRALFEHGMDPQIGNKPLGPISELREDGDGGYYDVELLDAPYVRETVLPGLRAGLYGASFKFRVMREDVEDEPDPSDENPKGLPTRTIREAQLFEFGPVTFPAYSDATAGVRSLTDDYLLRRAAGVDPELMVMAAQGADLGELMARRAGVRPRARRSPDEVAADARQPAAAPDAVPPVETESAPPAPEESPKEPAAPEPAPAEEPAVEEAPAEAPEGEQADGAGEPAPDTTEQNVQDGAADEQRQKAPRAAPRSSRTPLAGPVPGRRPRPFVHGGSREWRL